MNRTKNHIKENKVNRKACLRNLMYFISIIMKQYRLVSQKIKSSFNLI